MRYLLLLTALTGFVLSGNANAISVPTNLAFDCITSNGIGSCALGEAQLSATVHGDATSTDFTFYNTDSLTTENPSVHEIYFDSSLFDSWTATDIVNNVAITGKSWAGSDWAIEEKPSPKNLPSGNNVGFYAEFGADANSGNQLFGEDQWITINIDIAYSAFLLALGNDDFTLGLHVGALNGGESESFVSTSVVPVPAAFWLFGTALVGFIGMSRRIKVN